MLPLPNLCGTCASVCRCGHVLAEHRRPLGAPVAECTAWGCRCGLFRDALVQSPTRPSPDSAANDRGAK